MAVLLRLSAFSLLCVLSVISPGLLIANASPTTSVSARSPLHTTGIAKNVTVKSGVELRILPVGDSLTVGFEDPSGNGYRLELLKDLSGKSESRPACNRARCLTSNYATGNKVVYAGTESGGTFCDDYFVSHIAAQLQEYFIHHAHTGRMEWSKH